MSNAICGVAPATGHISPLTRFIAISLGVGALLLPQQTVMAGSGARPERQAGIATSHFPSSPAEKALAGVLERNNDDRRFYDFLTGRDGGRLTYRSAFGEHFTPKFLDAVAAVERRYVQSTCGGKYIEGELCGMDYDPLNCAQDTPPDGYLVQTVTESGKGLIIHMSWEVNGPVVARYRMVRLNGSWVLDGISCAVGDNFNW